MRINVKAARIQFCSLLKLCEEGQQVVITRRGRAVVRMRKVGPPIRTGPPPDVIERIFRQSERFEEELAKMFKDGGTE
jgi:antitoxin (DNA-binding transcriptional repressor) of toxin-antitoxin stability system